MDFKTLFGEPDPRFDDRVSKLKSRRRYVYKRLSDSENTRSLTAHLVAKVRTHCLTKVFAMSSGKVPDADFLDILSSSREKNPLYENKIVPTPAVIVMDVPLSVPINLAEDILERVQRNHATGKIQEFGTQHFFDNGMSDAETESNPSSSGNEPDGPLPKKRKTCQIAKKVECDSELYRHLANATVFPGRSARVDVLLFVFHEEARNDLAKHYGLINLEGLFIEAKRPVDLYGKRMADPTTKLFKALHSYINRDLMFGRSNIGVTSNQTIFHCVQANVKIMMSNTVDANFDFLSRVCSYIVEVDDNYNFLTYASGFTALVDKILGVKCNFTTYYADDEKLQNHLLCSSLIAVIPLYILRFFADLKLRTEFDNSSLELEF